jgi:hypothetical protein
MKFIYDAVTRRDAIRHLNIYRGDIVCITGIYTFQIPDS